MEAKKKRTKNILFFCAVALFVLGVALVPNLLRSQQEEPRDTASYLTTQVQKQDIRSTISGSGALTEEGAMAVSVPRGVEVTEYLVDNGQQVEEGQPLAKVDPASVMSTIATVQENLEYLAGELRDTPNTVKDERLNSPVAGRVKIIYAQAGDAVTDVLSAHGALAVVSLDGLMALDLETEEPLRAGDGVTVVLPDGAQLPGRVELARKGKVTVTLTDDGPVPGDAATVLTSDGEEIGGGELYIHSAWNITAVSGTVSRVAVEANGVVYEGSRIFNLTGVDHSAEYNRLATLHRAYEDTMLELFNIYQNGAVTAPVAGSVSGIDTAKVGLMSNPGEKEYAVVLLSAAGAPAAEESALPAAEAESASPEAEGSTAPSAEASPTTTPSDTPTTAPSDTPTPTPETTTPTPGGESGPSTETPTPGTTPETPPTTDAPPTSPNDPGAAGAYVNRYATVSDVRINKITFLVQRDATSAPDYKTVPAVDVENTDSLEFTVDKFNGVTVFVWDAENGTWVDGTPGDLAAGDLLWFVYKTEGEQQQLLWIIRPEQVVNEPPVEDFGGFEFFGGGGGGYAEEPFEMYQRTETQLMQVVPQDKMSVSVTIDEADILSVAIGQEAEVTVDALPGRAFTGTVTAINPQGEATESSWSRMNSKYDITVVVDRDEDMLKSMNATAILTVGVTEDVLTLPVEALSQRGSKTIVYTDYDPETRTLLDPVEITVGVSDGITAQILSGLEEGDAVWYSYYESSGGLTLTGDGGAQNWEPQVDAPEVGVSTFTYVD